MIAFIPGFPRESGEWPPSALLDELAQRVDLTVATWHFPPETAPYRQGRVKVVPLQHLRALPVQSIPDLLGGFDAVHAFWAGSHALVAVALARARRIPLVLSSLGGEGQWSPAFSYGTPPGSLAHRAAQLALRAADLVLVGSQRQLQQAWSASRLRATEILPVGVHPRFQPRPPLGEPSEGRLFCAASLVPIKGHALLIDALTHLPERFGLTLAGDGPERGALERQVGRLSLGSRVRFLGNVASEEVARLLEQAAIVVSGSHHEGGSVALLEALAVGRPVVSTAVGAAPELLSSGAGVIAPRDPRAFAEAILAVESNRPTFERAAARVGRGVIDQWRYPAVADRLIAHYSALARARG